MKKMMFTVGLLIVATVLLVLSGCKNLVIPDGVYMADVSGSKITVAGDYTTPSWISRWNQRRTNDMLHKQ